MEPFGSMGFRSRFIDVAGYFMGGITMALFDRVTLGNIGGTWGWVETAGIPAVLRRRSIVFAALLAVCLSALDTHAASINSGFSFLIGDGSFSGGSGPFAQCQGQRSCSDTDTQSVVGTFQLFDPALGTLTGVTMILDSTLRIGTEIVGLGSSGGIATATGEALYEIGDLLSGSVAAPPSSCTPFCNVFTPGGTQDFPLDATVGVPLAMLPDYVGIGTGNLQITETVTVNATSSAGLIARTRTNQLFTRGWEGTVTFVYDYQPVTAVPEPSSAILLGIGTIGMAVACYRRRYAS